MVSTRPLIFKSSTSCTDPLVTVPRAPITIVIIVLFMFHSLFNSLLRYQFVSLFFVFFLNSLWGLPGYQSIQFCNFSFFLLIIVRSGCQAEIWWSVCTSRSQRILWVTFSLTDSGLCIYHLFVWSNFNFLYNSQWVNLPTQSCLVLYSFCVNLLHLLIMWLIVSSLSPHNLHLLFCNNLSIFALMWLVLMLFFCAAIRRDSFSLLSFPFLAMSTFPRGRCRLLIAWNVHRVFFLPRFVFWL